MFMALVAMQPFGSCTGKWFRLVTARSGHCRRRLLQALVDQQLHFNATILSAAGARIVFGNWIRLTVAIRRDDASQRNSMILDQITNHVIRTTLAERAISGNAAGG